MEIDVRRTANRALVSLHDETVNRTANGNGRIGRLLLREIKTHSAGNGVIIPMLEEALTSVVGRAGPLLELKVHGMARQTVETVQEVGFTDPVIYASFLHDEPAQVHTFDPKATLMRLIGRLPLDPAVRAVTHGNSHVGLRQDTATRRLVDACHQAGLLVCVYTADNPRDIRHVLSLDVDVV